MTYWPVTTLVYNGDVCVKPPLFSLGALPLRLQAQSISILCCTAAQAESLCVFAYHDFVSGLCPDLYGTTSC